MRTALAVIDVQEPFRRLPDWAAVSDPDIAVQVNRLVEHARSRGDPVVWGVHAAPGSGGPFDPEKGLVRCIEGLEPRPGEPRLTKTSHNAFTPTGPQRLPNAIDMRWIDCLHPRRSASLPGPRGRRPRASS
jgi:nicotinamidase-related amidase